MITVKYLCDGIPLVYIRFIVHPDVSLKEKSIHYTIIARYQERMVWGRNVESRLRHNPVPWYLILLYEVYINYL